MQPVSPGASMVSPRLFSPENQWLLLHHTAHVIGRGRGTPRHEPGFRSRPHPFDRRARGHARPFPAAVDCPASSGLHSQDPAQRCVRGRLGLLRRGDVCAARVIRERPGRTAAGCALGAGARSAGDRGSEARFGRMDLRAGGRLLCPRERLTREAAGAAAAAIATNPGYFIAYTVGRWQIQQLLSPTCRRPAPRARCTIFMTGCFRMDARRWPSWARNCLRISTSRRAQCGQPRTIEVQTAHAPPPVSELTFDNWPAGNTRTSNNFGQFLRSRTGGRARRRRQCR